MIRLRIPLFALVLVAAAFSGDHETTDTVPDATTTMPATTVASTTSTSATTPSTAAPSTTASPPTTSASTAPASADDWRGIIEVLGQRRQDLYAAPDVSGIGAVCADSSQCSEQLEVQLADLADKGWRVTGADPFTVVEAEVEKFDGDSLESSLLVTVIAVVERPEVAGEIVDDQGTTIAAVEAETKVGFNSQGRYVLARVGPTEDPWRLVSQELIREVPA